MINDHPLFRKELAHLLAACDDFEVVGQAASGGDGINLAVSLLRGRFCLSAHSRLERVVVDDLKNPAS